MFLLIMAFWGCGLTLGAQDGVPETLTWFGIDYSQAKFIGSPADFSDLPKIQGAYFSAWNNFFLSEGDKYDVKKAFGVRKVEYAMDLAVERSMARSMDGIVQSGSWELGKEELATVLKHYMKKGKEGTGALFIMETLNKTDAKSTMWLVTFDMASGDIHHLKRYMGTPGGFGFRNYWARSYYNVLTALMNNPRKPF